MQNAQLPLAILNVQVPIHILTNRDFIAVEKILIIIQETLPIHSLILIPEIAKTMREQSKALLVIHQHVLILDVAAIGAILRTRIFLVVS